ncbi:TolC family protein [Oxalobacter sp. OxGP1]|uniref:efflux transporter outer membrane subunit n=1 Tax=Oxalobacter paeniformigenes TaxID=2946594 RepID=UPI0022B00D46|nr:TolC family protein [Oxalobacter paeniformigenes]MCZ4052821.1 TolC family protein [Oxalobacter paeniformigenes]
MCNKKLLSCLVPLLACSVLTGCMTVGPDYKIPENATVNQPDAAKPFAAAETGTYVQEPLPEHWWKLYDDPVLTSLIEKALVANTDLRVAAANLARARAVLEEVEMGTVPTVDVEVAPKFGRNSAAADGLPERYPDRWSHDSGINISYQLDLFGKIARGIEAASADTEAAQAAYDLARITIAADTAKAYADACSSAYRVKIAEHSADLQKQFLDTTTQLTVAGRGTAMDISRASAQHEALRAAIPPLKAQQKLALYRLAVLTGELPNTLVDTVGQCSKPPQLSQPIPVGDGATLLRRRPDIRQAERQMAAASAQIGVATADLYPSINLGLSGGMTSRFSSFGDNNTFRWGIGPLITWTLPNTGTARSRIKQAEAEHQAAFARFDATVLNALRETESALTTYARELDRNAALKAARDQSALANDQARRLYRHGRIDFLSTLDSERTLAADESAYAASTAKLVDDQISVFLALGGGWEQNVQPAESDKQ